MGLGRFPVMVRLLGIVAAWVVVAGLLTFVPAVPVAVADGVAPAQVALVSDKIEFVAGSRFTLTASVDQPLEDTSSVLTIRDLTAGADVKQCSSGTECRVELSFVSGGPREYVATVGTLRSQVVSVARTAWVVGLVANHDEIGAGELATLTATLNQDLSATSGTYAVAVFNVTTGKRVHVCDAGTVCEVQVSAYADRVSSADYVAVVLSAADTASQTVAAATDVQASSDVVSVARKVWSLETTADSQVLRPGEHTRIRVAADQDIGDTNGLYSIYVFEMSKGGRFVAQCDVGRECVASVGWGDAEPWGGYFMAVVAERRASSPSSFGDVSQDMVPSVGASVASVQVPGWEATLTSTADELGAGDTAEIKATANQNLGDTEGRYTLYIIDYGLANKIVASCTEGTRCNHDFSFYGTDDDYGVGWASFQAVVAPSGAETLNDLHDQRAFSQMVWIERKPWKVKLEQTSLKTFTLSTNQDIGHSHGSWAWYFFGPSDDPLPDRSGACYSGTRCVFSVPLATSRVYSVYLVRATDSLTWGDWKSAVLAYAQVDLGEPVSGPELVSPVSGRGETTGGQNPAEGPCECGRADPVNTATGEFSLPEMDLGLAGAGPSLSVARTYSSDGVGATGPFGYGWAGNVGARLNVLLASDDSNPLPRQVEVEQENGSILIFTRHGSSSEFGTPARVLATLAWSSTDNRWTLTRRTDEILLFDEDGRLTTAKDSDGNALRFTYNAGKLHTIEATGGRRISLTWSGDLITRVSDSAGRDVEYAYDAVANLVSVVAADGAVTTYEYDSAHRMTAFVRPGGGRTENVFDGSGRVASQKDPIGRVTVFEYGDMGTTTTTRPDGVRNVDRYVEGMLVEQTLAEGTASQAVTQYGYNERNLVASALDPLGGVTTYAYDTGGNRITQVDALGRQTSWTYGSHNNPLTVTDPVGRTTTLTYTSTGRPLTTTSPSGSEQRWTYNSDGTVATYKNASGAVTAYGYDAAGRVTTMTDAEGRETAFAYNAFGLLSQTTTPDGHSTTTTYDQAGRTLTVKDPLENLTTYTYDAAGNPASETDPEGGTTSYTYDAAGQQLTATDPAGGVASFTYDPAGNLATSIDPNQNTTTMAYDHYGNIVTVTDPLNRVTTSTYDLAGRLVGTKLPSGALTISERDAAGQIVKSTDPLGKITTYEYNAAGQPTKVKDPLGRVTSTTYSDDARLKKTTFPDQSTQSYEYDAAGRVTSFTNADGRETTYTYTATGLLASRTEPGGLTTTFAYDGDAQLARETLPDETETSYSYDAAGQLTAIAHSRFPSRNETFAYDHDGRTVRITDLTGTTTLTYDPVGRLASETDGSGDALAYRYDNAGRLTSIGYPNADNVTYGYDKADHLTSLTDWSNRTSTFTWTPDGQLAAQTTANGVTQTHTYDPAGQVTSLTASKGSIQLATFEYSYDDAGQLTTQTSQFSGAERSSEFTHDALGQLSGIQRHDGTSASVNIPVAATPAGMLVTTDDGSELTYNAAQQVTHRDPVTGPDTSYSYNANGARAQKTTNTSPTTTTSSYTYDPDGHLQHVSTPTATIEYTTDARGLRQTRDAGTTENFLWSTVKSLPLLVADQHHYYIYGPGSTPLAQIDKTTGVPTYLHADSLGSVRLTTDTAGTTLGTQTFTEYGSILSATGTIGTTFGFTGNWTDPDTGLVHLRARDYDPETGQFISIDPALEDTRQPYTYAANNPIQYTDPTGLDLWGDVTKSVVAFGLGVLDGATFGISGIIASAVVPGYDCFIEQNKGFYTAGEITGTIASTVALSAISAGSLGAAAMGAKVAITSTVKAGIAIAKTAARVTVKAITKTVTKAATKISSKFAVRTAARSATNGAVRLGESGVLNPSTIRFSQNSISGAFRNGGGVKDLATGLKNGTINPNDIPAIRLVERDGQYFSLDNRRLAAFQEAGLDIPYRMATPAEIAGEGWKFTTTNGGTSIVIRGGGR